MMMSLLGFIIVAILMSITGGAFISMIILANTKISGWKEVVIGIILSIAIGCAISGMFVLGTKINADSWNNGNCYNCNTQWELVNVQKMRSTTHYYYSCPNCGEVIDLTQKPY
jgi:hypothetical protein